MTSPPTNADLDRLSWKPDGEYQTATDGSCMYLRETRGSMIAGFVFAVVIGGGGGAYGSYLLVTDASVGGRVFALLMLFVAAAFAWIFWTSLRRGRWVGAYDRGGPGVEGEIRFPGKHLPVARVRCISTRLSGGSPSLPRRMVVAELHDGGLEPLGPSSVSTWPEHYGQRIAMWLGLPFRHSSE